MKILILGAGAQGSTVAQRMDEQPHITEMIVADYDMKAVEGLVKTLKKAKGVQVDASSVDNIVAVAEGVELIVNALPLFFGRNVLDAALKVKTNYQDFSTPNLAPLWADGVDILRDEYDKKFKEIGKLALSGTGSAPGLICVASRKAVEPLDTCETVYNLVFEGVEAKRFMPFWWSPINALEDMCEVAYAYEDGKLVKTVPFSNPVTRKYDYIDEEITFVEHCHDEPVYMGLNAEEFFKGAKNFYFKYTGTGCKFAEPLYRAGLLSREPEEINGVEIAPFDVILAHIPHPPTLKAGLQEIVDEGLVADTGCMVIEAYGKKDGKDTLVEVHVNAPGFMESFEKAGLSGEMYLTGQGGYLFTKMLTEGKFHQVGAITTDMVTYEQADIYFEEAAKLDITLDIIVKEI